MITNKEPNGSKNNVYLLLNDNNRCVYASNGWKAFIENDPDTSNIINTMTSGPTQSSIKIDQGVLHFEKIPSIPTWGEASRIIFLERGTHAKPSFHIDDALNEFETDDLTQREKQLLRLIILGFRNDKIAKKLEIGIGTIRNHRKRLYQKMAVTAERELFVKFLNLMDKKII